MYFCLFWKQSSNNPTLIVLLNASSLGKWNNYIYNDFYNDSYKDLRNDTQRKPRYSWKSITINISNSLFSNSHSNKSLQKKCSHPNIVGGRGTGG